jgi:hypothetical protein
VTSQWTYEIISTRTCIYVPWRATGLVYFLLVITASSLTSSPTSIFWLTIIAIAVAVVAGAIALIAWRAEAVRKRLLLSITSRTRLLITPEPMREELRVSYQDEKLEDPYVVSIELSNVGKSPIKSEDFDKGRNLTFSVGAPIVKVLSTEHEPTSAPAPVVTTNSNSLEIGPELIAKDESIRVTLLTEGRVGEIEATLKPFGDVDIQFRDREAWLIRRTRRRAISAAGTVVFLLAVALLISTLTLIRSQQSLSLGEQAAVGAACVDLIDNAQGMDVALNFALADITISKDSAGKVKSISFFSGYDKTVSASRVVAKNLIQSYSLVRQAGTSLGRTASMPAKINQVELILSRLPKEGATSKAYSDFETATAIDHLLPGSQSIPSGC